MAEYQKIDVSDNYDSTRGFGTPSCTNAGWTRKCMEKQSVSLQLAVGMPPYPIPFYFLGYCRLVFHGHGVTRTLTRSRLFSPLNEAIEPARRLPCDLGIFSSHQNAEDWGSSYSRIWNSLEALLVLFQKRQSLKLHLNFRTPRGPRVQTELPVEAVPGCGEELHKPFSAFLCCREALSEPLRIN